MGGEHEHNCEERKTFIFNGTRRGMPSACGWRCVYARVVFFGNRSFVLPYIVGFPYKNIYLYIYTRVKIIHPPRRTAKIAGFGEIRV